MFEGGHRVFRGNAIPSAVSKRDGAGPIKIWVFGHRATLAQARGHAVDPPVAGEYWLLARSRNHTGPYTMFKLVA